MSDPRPFDPTAPNPLVAPPLAWGILAPGGVANLFARDVLAHTNATIAAVGSRDAGRAQEFADRFDIPRAYGSYEELLADDDVEAVYIASPHSHHYRHARAAISAGKHTLVEKSFTHNALEAESVFYVARDAGVHVMEAMWSRFLPHFYTLRALLARRVIGKIVHVYAAHGQAISHVPRMAQPELAGGALLDLGVYPISLVHHILGRPRSIHASGHLTPSGVDETVGITMTFRTAVASIATTMLGRSNNIVEITGTAGRITISDTFYATSAEITVHVDGQEPYTIGGQVPGGYHFQAAEMARNVRAGVLESPLMTWQNTIDVMAIMDEVRRQIGVEFPGERR